MNIKRMMLLAGMALAAIAFAAPATAGAVVELPGLEEGDPVTATSTNLKMTTTSGTIECGKVTLHFHLLTNGPNHVTLWRDWIHNATTENCALNVGGGIKIPTHITNAGTGAVPTLNTWGTGVTSATFTSEITTVPVRHCTFHGNVHLQATNNSEIAHVAGSTLTGTGTNCPTAALITGAFTLESNGVHVKPKLVTTG